MSAAPVDIGRAEARRAAANELSKGKYEDESLLDRFWRWLEDLVTTLVAGAVEGGPAGVVALVVIGLVLLGLVAALARSLRRTSGAGARRTPWGTDDRQRTAAEHRAAAERFAATGAWAAAIRERLRAVARTLEERHIVAELPAHTADEMAAAAGDALPALGDQLSTAARLFDAVTYGEEPGTEQDYAVLVALDEAVADAEPDQRAVPAEPSAS